MKSSKVGVCARSKIRLNCLFSDFTSRKTLRRCYAGFEFVSWSNIRFDLKNSEYLDSNSHIIVHSFI